FAVRVDRQGDAAVVHLSGSCTMTCSETLGNTLRELGSEGFRVIAVDVSKLDFIESSGLGGIVAGYLRTRKHKGELRLVNPAPDILRVFEMTRLVQLFGIYPSVEAAIAATPAS